ncbi:rRNA methyltransferase 3, mitochondrial [Papilio machaon]|uniref:rRNA methyltransferase 3, mitochondrial n=1 Tax=Papilio machaon TaxID=76193 RepID=UPI001E6658D7|nr:rRNA methyltransferase 3, mitochondrial [Papilio machaon]
MANTLCRPLLQTVTIHSATFRFARHYGRWMHRNPAKVILPFEPKDNIQLRKEKVIELDLNDFKKTTKKETSQKNNETLEEPLHTKINFKEVKDKKETVFKKRLFYLSQKKVFDDNNEIIYEKLKDNDTKISSLFVKLKSKKERLRSNQIMVEGWRMIVDGLEAKCNLQYILFSRKEDLNNIRPFMPKTGIQIYKIPYKEMELWSDVETCPGIVGVFEMPSPDKIKRFSKPLPLQFLCDNIRVPGNLGAILRAAVGVGCEKVLVSKGCVDVWDSKVMRSAAGAHFRLPIYPSIEWEEMPQHLPSDTSLFIADSNTDFAENKTEEVSKAGSEIPVLPYYGVDFSALNHVTLIIGGETESISEMSYRLGVSNNGSRLHIPLHKGVDSLNTGMAAAVIAFEIRKQLTQAAAKAKLERQAMKT